MESVFDACTVGLSQAKWRGETSRVHVPVSISSQDAQLQFDALAAAGVKT